MDSSPTFMSTAVEYVIRRVEAARDYAPHRFRMFRAVQRAGRPGSKTGSLDDRQKMYSTICYLAIGLHNVHLIPVCSPTNKSMTALHTMTAASHAILNLASLSISELDDSFSLSFRYVNNPGPVITDIVELTSCEIT